MPPTVDDVLEHFGIKGMRWGVRRREGPDGTVSSGKIPVESSHDAARAQDYRTRARSDGTHTLSNQELKHLVDRLALEQRYSELTSKQTNVAKARKGHERVKEIVGVGITLKQVHELATSRMVKDVRSAINRKSKD